MSEKSVSLAQQIEEIEREIALRVGVYARQIASGKMKKSVAEFHMERLRSVLRTLYWLQANDSWIRASATVREKQK